MELRWESDPSLPQNQRINEILTNSNNVQLLYKSETPLSGSVVRYEYKVEPYSEQAINNVYTLIDEIRYVPLVFSVSRPIDERVLNHLSKTLLTLLSDDIPDLTDNVITQYDDRIDIGFVDENSELLYVQPNEYSRLLREYSPETLRNLVFITKSPLIEYAINADNGLYLNAAKAKNFITINGSTFLRFADDSDEYNYMIELADQINQVIESYTLDGYYALDKSDELAREIGVAFNIPFIDFERTRVFKTTDYFDQDILINSEIEITDNKLPYLQIETTWMFLADPTLDNRARLAAASIIAYLQLENPYLIPLLPFVKPSHDLSVSAYFSSAHEVDQYKSILNRMLNNSGNWAVRPVNEPLTIARIRYLTQPTRSLGVYVDELLFLVFLTDEKTDTAALMEIEP